MLSETTTVNESSSSESATGGSTMHPLMAISEHSSIVGMPGSIKEWLRSLPPVSPASRFPLPADVGAAMTPETCGQPPSNAFASYDPVGSIWRTSQASLFETFDDSGEWYALVEGEGIDGNPGLIWTSLPTSDEYCQTWPKAGMMLDGDVFRQPSWERPMGETGSGLWPTPAASEARQGLQIRREGKSGSQVSLTTAAQMWRTPSAGDGDHGGPNSHDSGGAPHLSAQAALFPTPTSGGHTQNQSIGGPVRPTLIGMARHGTWPTPKARDYKAPSEAGMRRKSPNLPDIISDVVSNWPTPQARDGDQRGAQAKRYHDPARSNDLPDAVASTPQELPTPTANRRSGLQSHGINVVQGQLNPEFVEWLMWWPRGWTSLDPLQSDHIQAWRDGPNVPEWDGVPRVASGIPHRASRLRATGNGQSGLCPSTAVLFFTQHIDDNSGILP